MKIPTLTSSLISGLTLLLFAQCQNVTPQAPPAEGFDPPIPPARSYLTGSITLPLRELEAKINRELDPVLVGRGSKKGSKASLIPFRVIRSGSVKIRYVNQQVRFSAPLQVQLMNPLRSKAGTPSPKPFCAINVDFRSPLTLTSAWRLSSHVKFVDYQWTVEPQIKLLGKTISLADFARSLIETYQPAIEAAIDSAVYNDLRLDRMAAPIWRDVQKPLLLNKQYGLWLLPQPIGVMASPIRGDSRQITAPILITLNPQTRLEAQKPVPQPGKLPLLQKRDQLPKTSDLRLMSLIPYADINRIATRILRSKNGKLALGSLTVRQVSVYGGQRSVIVKTVVSGLVNGTLYLRGRPGFDTTTNTLRITNLDFDAGTYRALPKLVGTVLRRGICRLLEELVSVSVGEEIDQLPQKIDAAFETSSAGKKMNIAIRSFRFIPQRIAIRPEGIQVLIRVQSNVAMQVQQL